MPSDMPRQKTEIRKEQIKKAVLNIIRNAGIKAVSTKNLAREVQLSEGAIFRHFRRKQDIIHAIVNDVATDLIGMLEDIAGSTLSPQKKLEAYICRTVRYLIKNDGITILLFSEATYNNDEDMLEKLRYIFDAQQKNLEKILREGMEEGIWRKDLEVEDISKLYMGIPVTLNINLTLHRTVFDQSHYCNRMTRLLLEMLRA